MKYNILDFGAVGDGASLNTESIQSAIDECSRNGGGTVFVPKGDFLTGTIYLKSNITIYLEKGAVLLGSTNLVDYNDDDAYPENYGCKVEEWRGKHLIIARECENITIKGDGVIDGNAESFFEEPIYFKERYVWRMGYCAAKDKENLRPGQLICFIKCKGIDVRDITIRNTSCWGLFFHGCEVVTVRGVKVKNPCNHANTDGIDIDCSKYVTVSDCIIITGDDAIAIRCDEETLGTGQTCEYVTISNCVLSSLSSGIRIGVGTGEIRHIRISNIVIERCLAALCYMTSYEKYGEAIIEDVNASGISVTNGIYPITFTGDRGSIKNVTVSDMRALCAGSLKICAEEGCDISEISLKNIDISIIPEERELTDELLSFRGVDVVSIKNAKNITLNRVRVFGENLKENRWEKMLGYENAENLCVLDCMF